MLPPVESPAVRRALESPLAKKPPDETDRQEPMIGRTAAEQPAIIGPPLERAGDVDGRPYYVDPMSEPVAFISRFRIRAGKRGAYEALASEVTPRLQADPRVARRSLRPLRPSRRWHAKCNQRQVSNDNDQKEDAMYWGGGIIGLILLILLILLLTGNL